MNLFSLPGRLEEFFKDLPTPPPPPPPHKSIGSPSNEETLVMLITRYLLFTQEAERAGQKTAKCYFLDLNGGMRGYKPKIYRYISVAKHIFTLL